MHSTYFELYRMHSDRHFLHQKLVTFARAHGVNAVLSEWIRVERVRRAEANTSVLQRKA